MRCKVIYITDPCFRSKWSTHSSNRRPDIIRSRGHNDQVRKLLQGDLVSERSSGKGVEVKRSFIHSVWTDLLLPASAFAPKGGGWQ
jgi:hypothetical protein